MYIGSGGCPSRRRYNYSICNYLVSGSPRPATPCVNRHRALASMSLHVSQEELEYLRTAPSKAIHRSSRRVGRVPAWTLSSQDEIGQESRDEGKEHERWREYCEYEPGKYMKLPKTLKRLWKQMMTDNAEGIRELLLVAGRGVMQTGMVWGAAFCGRRYPTNFAKKKADW